MSLSSKLSPKLRKAVFQKSGDTVVRGLVEIAPGTDQEALGRALALLGAEIRTRSEHAHLLTIDIPVNRLTELDGVHGIVYVEADERYRR